jgi:hypothetical protein
LDIVSVATVEVIGVIATQAKELVITGQGIQVIACPRTDKLLRRSGACNDLIIG